MADIVLRSLQQIEGRMIAKLLAETDLNDLSPGSVWLTMIEAAAGSDFQTEGKLLQLMNIRNLDKTTGTDLEKLALELGVTPSRIGASPARAKVTIGDSAFTKVFSNIYSGLSSPVAGDTSIAIVDGSGFSASGTIYIARGFASYEAVSYISAVDSGPYWTLTLSSPLGKDHLVGEEVVLAQGGNRLIPAGTTVSAGSGVDFNTIVDYTILDGEDSLPNIDVTASTPGESGNVGRNKITQFSGSPFSTATVTNPDPANGGKESETDAELRQRVKDHVHNLGRGTKKAIYRAVIGVSDPDEGKRVISAFLREPAEAGQIGVLFIDDGTGFAPTFSGIGEEVLVTSAAGTEQFLQLQKWPVVKAQAASISLEPFKLVGGEQFLFEVDGTTETQTIPSSYFRSPGVVTAQEIAEAINTIYTTVEARAKDGRLFVTPTASDPDYIRVGVATNDANASVRFPTNRQYTIRLYKNDVLLEKSGRAGSLQSKPNSQWPVFASSETIQLQVDGIAFGMLITFTDADFAANTSSLTINGASASDWVKIFNLRIPGIQAKANDDGSFTLTSNLGNNDKSEVKIIGGSLNGTLFEPFAGTTGKGSDFKLNRLLGQIELAERLVEGDELKAGTVNTRAFFDTTENASFNLPLTLGSPGRMVIVANATTASVAVAQTGVITFTIPTAGVQRIAGSAGQFSSVRKDDYAFLYNTPRNALLKVKDVDPAGAYVDFFDPAPTGGSATINGASIRISFFRTSGIPQVFELPVGPEVTGSDLATAFNAQITGAKASITNGGAVRFQTLRFSSEGGLGLPVIAGSAFNLGIDEGSLQSNDPHVASIESADLAGYPTGRFTIATADNTLPYTQLNASGTPFPDVSFANRPVLTYIGSAQAIIRQPQEKLSSSQLLLRNYTPFQNIGLGADMRGTTSDGLELGEKDNIVFLIDDDATQKTFDIPMNLQGQVAGPSVPNLFQFDANDSSGANLGTSSRWLGYEFADYKLLLRARKDLVTQGPNTGIRIRSVGYGDNGKKIRAGLVYPSAPLTAPSASYEFDAVNETISINSVMGSGAERIIGMGPNAPIYVSYTGSGPYTYRVQMIPPVDLSSVLVNDMCALADQTFSSANRATMRVTAITNLVDSAKTFQHLVEEAKGDIVGGTSLSLTTSTTQTIRPGDKIVKKSLYAQASVIGASTVDVPVASNFSAGPSTFTANAITFNYTSYTSATGQFAGVTPAPTGLINPGDDIVQSVANETSYVVSGSGPYTISPSIGSGSNFIYEITHASLTANAPISFSPAVNDKLQVLSNIYNINTIFSATEFGVNNPFQFTGSQAGVFSRVILTLSRQQPGVNESVNALSAQSLRVFELDATVNNAQAMIDAINNTAGVNLLVEALSSSGSDGTGVLTQSTEDVLGSAYESLLNGSGVISSSANSSPNMTLKYALDMPLEIGELFKIQPITPKNAADHLAKKQISGLSVAADVALVNVGRSVQVSSKVPGGFGQVYAVGGRASSSTFLDVKNNIQEISATKAIIELDASAREVVQPGHLVKVSQTGLAKKEWTAGSPTPTDTIEITIPSTGVGQITCSKPFASIYSYTHTGTVVWAVRKLSRNRYRYEAISGTATLPAGYQSGDWVLVGNGSAYAGITPPSLFASANQGLFQIVEAGSVYFDVDNSSGVEEYVSASASPFLFAPYHSAQVGDKIVLDAEAPVATANKGTFTITEVVDANTVKYTNPSVEIQAPVAFGPITSSVYLLDRGYSTYRRVVMVLPKPSDPSTRSLMVVTPGYDMALFSESASARIELPNRLGFSSQPVPGMNGYSYWIGLKQRVQYTLDGYAPDSATFPGVRAAGVAIEAREPQIQRVSLSIRIKTKEGVALSSISDSIKNAVVGYVNSLGLGQDVVISEIISLIQQTSGVDAVVFLIPAPGTERITIADKAIARTSSNDVVLS
jgi:hypothetical protein